MHQEQSSRGFLIRPFWRDWVLSYVLIGLGFMLTAPQAPVHRWVGVLLLALGTAIFLAAVGHALWRAFPRGD
jgi:hypothetical protein